jgi:hypothetical protein
VQFLEQQRIEEYKKFQTPQKQKPQESLTVIPVFPLKLAEEILKFEKLKGQDDPEPVKIN